MDKKFILIKPNGTKVTSLGNVYCKIYRKVNDIKLFIRNLTTETFQLKDITDRVVKLAVYSGDIPTDVVVSLKEETNVKAVWFTPVIDFGTNLYSKTMLGFTIATEPSVNGKVEFGFETKKLEKLIQSHGVNVFDFYNLDFNNFTFATSFATSYTKKINERNINFVIFKLVSDNKYDCAINEFSVLYKINKKNRGVW